jgi:hypothetical protein
MKNLKEIELKFDDVISIAETSYGDHEGVRRPNIIRWIAQFPRKSQNVAAKVLGGLTYYSASNIHALTRELVAIVYENFKIAKNKIFFIPIGGAGSGSQIIARHLKSIGTVPKSCVLNLIDVGRIKPSENQVIVLIDDFSGTGQTIKDWWKNVSTLLLPTKAKIILGILVLNSSARNNIEEVGPIFCTTELNETHNVFHINSRKFDDKEKKQLLHACQKTGCHERFLRGNGENGLLVVFKHGCPNNSLPILWHEKVGYWEKLFNRRND